MGYRIKEICKEKNVSMADIAKSIGISPVTLSQSLHGNPTLSRLQEVADALGVGVPDLFERETEPQKSIKGCVFVDDVPKLIRSKQDIQDILDTL